MRLGAVVLGAVCLALPLAAQSGGDGTIYYGTYSKKILVIDEASLRVTDSMAVSVGIPYGLWMSANRSRIYAMEPSREQVEIFDVASRRSVGRFSLSTPTTQVRLWGFNVDPQDRFAVVLVKTYEKKDDRFVIGRPVLLRYDIERKVVTDTIKWPGGQEREFAQILFSPKGDLIYFFTNDDVLIFDSATLRQVDRWDLGRSLDEGMGRFNFGFPESFYEEDGFFTGLFRSTDPVNNRTLMGIARVDLVNRQVEFSSLGPSEPVGFALAPGRRRGYGLRQQPGNYQFWTFDIEGRRVTQRTEFEGRPRMGLTVSSNGTQLYIHTAGNTIDVYDAESKRLIRSVAYDADMTDIIVVPR
ncbi:MAG: hypothetical protein ACT4OZ_11915 [Gemmatimonadota bacterium]